MTSGRVSTSRSLSPFRSRGWSREALAAEVRFGQLVALDHRAHRAVEDEDAAVEERSQRVEYGLFIGISCSCRLTSCAVSAGRSAGVFGQSMLLVGCAAPAGFVPLRDQHRERVAGSCARRRVTLTSVSPASVSNAFEPLVAEAEPAIAEPVAHPGLVVLAQIEHQHAAAGHEDARRLGERARGIVGVVQRLRQQRDVDAARRAIGSFSSSPRFQMTLRDAAPRRQRPARASSTSGDRSTAITRDAQRLASIVR